MYILFIDKIIDKRSSRMDLILGDYKYSGISDSISFVPLYFDLAFILDSWLYTREEK